MRRERCLRGSALFRRGLLNGHYFIARLAVNCEAKGESATFESAHPRFIFRRKRKREEGGGGGVNTEEPAQDHPKDFLERSENRNEERDSPRVSSNPAALYPQRILARGIPGYTGAEYRATKPNSQR